MAVAWQSKPWTCFLASVLATVFLWQLHDVDNSVVYESPIANIITRSSNSVFHFIIMIMSSSSSSSSNNSSSSSCSN